MTGPSIHSRTKRSRSCFARVAIGLFLLLCMAAACVAQSFPSPSSQLIATNRNRYESDFSALKSEFESSSAARQAVLVTRAYELRQFVDTPAEVAAWLRSIAGNQRINQLVRDEATRYLAEVDLNTADLAGAELKLKSLGLVRDWSIVGPLALAGLDSQVSPEHGFRAGAEFTDRTGRRHAWRHIGAPGPQLWIDLLNFGSGSGTVYAASSVHSESASQVALRFGSDSAISVYVNGTRVFADDAETTAAFDQYAVAVQLNAGWNSIVLKVVRRADGPSRFALRITGMEGGGIAPKTSATQDQAQARRPDPIGKNIAHPQDLVDRAQAELAADPNSADKLETAGLIELAHQRGSALSHLEAAAHLDSSADRWLEVADACTEERCKFQALTAALQDAPDNEPATIALADYYISRNQSEKARELLRRAASLAPGDFVAKDRLADLYTSAGLNALALKQSRELQRQYPGPLWLKYKLAMRYAQLDQLSDSADLLRCARRDNFSDSNVRALFAQVLRRMHDANGLQTLLAESARVNPFDTASLAQLSDVVAATGNLAAAQRVMRDALDIDPDSTELQQHYADLLARSGNNDAANQQLVNALARNPERDDLRVRLQLASSQSPGADSEAAYLEDASQLAAAAQRSSAVSNSNAVALSDVRVERVFDTGLSSVRVQQIYYIATEQGARKYRSQSIQYAPASQRLRVLHARIYKSDGRTIEGSDAGDSRVADASIAMYYDVRSHEVQFPGLQKGDVIELDYSITPTTTTNPYGNYFGSLVVFRGSVPAKLKRYVLVAPANRTFNIVEKRMPASVRITERNGERIYRWDANELAALPNESRGPSVTEVAPYVHVSTFASWDELGRWYADMIRPQFTLDSSLRDVADQLVAGKKTELEKINAIYQFVLRNTHYVALEFGIYSYKPYPVTQTYARRFGDCKDKASLMIALLRQAGIEADFALLRTRHMGDIDTRATSIALFDHAIVYLPKWDLWLDGTAEYFRTRELPVQDQGAMALVVAADGASQLRRVPVTRPEDNYTRRTVRAVLTENGTIRFEGDAYTRGEDAPGLRRDMEVPERQRDSFRNSLAQVFPSVRVDDVRVRNGDDPEQAVNVDFRGTIDTFSGRNVVPLATSWMQRSYVQTLAPLVSRSEELMLPAPWTTEEELHFQLPAGAQVTYLPRNTELNTQFGTARIQYEKHGHEILVKTSLQFRALRITPADYPAFRDFCRSVERAFRDEVKVTLRG